MVILLPSMIHPSSPTRFSNSKQSVTRLPGIAGLELFFINKDLGWPLQVSGPAKIRSLLGHRVRAAASEIWGDCQLRIFLTSSSRPDNRGRLPFDAGSGGNNADHRYRINQGFDWICSCRVDRPMPTGQFEAGIYLQLAIAKSAFAQRPGLILTLNTFQRLRLRIHHRRRQSFTDSDLMIREASNYGF
jgi:hypothetical protein